ncbi:MAG: zinc transporter ZupT, partial [Deltaproteobacteria bacterium]|nr:zinc transporter ZupT [Deltaproteobacteria bacterium]
MSGSVLTAFLLTLFAGLSTGIGSLVVFFSKKPSFRILSFGLGFSGGVMIFISLVELLPQAERLLRSGLGESVGGWVALGSFFGGIGLSALIDKLVPEPENPHEVATREQIERVRDLPNAEDPATRRSVARVGVLTAVAIAVHNFPEGMATFVSGLSDQSLGLSVAVAVAIHNIPEGIAVAVLVYFATQSRSRALVYSFASGLAEPLGALLVYTVLGPFIDDTVVGVMLGCVAGVMVFISFDELLPTAR